MSWGHITQLSSILNNGVGDWELFKADHEAAYKQLPLTLSDQDTSIIALINPRDKLWYGFASRTLVSGSIAAVIHYNVFSRLITELAWQLLGAPLVSFFADFAAIMKRLLVDSVLCAFSEFRSLLGIKLEESKSEAGPDVTFLGLRASFPSHSGDCELSVRLGETKRTTAWIALVGHFLKTESISHQELEKLIGRLSFPPSDPGLGIRPRPTAPALRESTHQIL